MILRFSLVLFLIPTFAFAEEDVFDLAAKYNATKKDLNNLESQKRKVLSDIYTIEKETNKLVLKKTELDEEKLNLDGKLSNLSKQIVEIEGKVRILIPELVERLSFADKISGLPWLYTILTAQSLSELDTTFEIAEYINEQQGEKVIEFVKLMESLKKQKTELKKTALKIVLLKKELQSQEKLIEQNQKGKKAFLKNLEKRLLTETNNLKKIKGQGKKALRTSFFKDLSLLFGSRFFDQKGQLPHPIEAPLFHEYGLNQGLLPDRVQLVHKGYFYRTHGPKKAQSISGGRVRFVGPAKGFGQVVVIDHGSRYYSTYANLKSSQLKPNQEVKQGAVVGVTGFDHLQFGTGLYFEIRHFSQPQNPENWLKKPKEHLANL